MGNDRKITDVLHAGRGADKRVRGEGGVWATKKGHMLCPLESLRLDSQVLPRSGNPVYSRSSHFSEFWRNKHLAQHDRDDNTNFVASCQQDRNAFAVTRSQVRHRYPHPPPSRRKGSRACNTCRAAIMSMAKMAVLPAVYNHAAGWRAIGVTGLFAVAIQFHCNESRGIAASYQ